MTSIMTFMHACNQICRKRRGRSLESGPATCGETVVRETGVRPASGTAGPDGVSGETGDAPVFAGVADFHRPLPGLASGGPRAERRGIASGAWCAAVPGSAIRGAALGEPPRVRFRGPGPQRRYPRGPDAHALSLYIPTSLGVPRDDRRWIEVPLMCQPARVPKSDDLLFKPSRQLLRLGDTCV